MNSKKARRIRREYGVKHIHLAKEWAGDKPREKGAVIKNPSIPSSFLWKHGRMAGALLNWWRAKNRQTIFANLANEAGREHDIRMDREWRK